MSGRLQSMVTILYIFAKDHLCRLCFQCYFSCCCFCLTWVSFPIPYISPRRPSDQHGASEWGIFMYSKGSSNQTMNCRNSQRHGAFIERKHSEATKEDSSLSTSGVEWWWWSCASIIAFTNITRPSPLALLAGTQFPIGSQPHEAERECNSGLAWEAAFFAYYV